MFLDLLFLAQPSIGSISVLEAVGIMWKALGAIWLVGLFFRRPSLAQQSISSRIFQSSLAFLGFAFLGSEWFRFGWLSAPFVPPATQLQYLGFAMTLAGCLLAIWARVSLGANWSGRVSLQKGHKLVVDGPYALTRHPIYSGFLLAATGTALVIAEARALVGLVLIFLSLAIKISLEEQLMLRAFPQDYPVYRKRVKALIPGVL